VSEDRAELLRRASDGIDQVSKRQFRSPDEAFAALFEVQAQLNAALATAGGEHGAALHTLDLRKTFEELIGRFIEVARKIATEFKAPSFSISVGGWPPSVSLTLTFGS
jgi:hypothetical protein